MSLPSKTVPYTQFPALGIKSETENKILDFGRLPEGWHYGGGGPISRRIIVLALKLHEAAVELGLNDSDAFPGEHGELMVSFYHKNHSLEFIIEPDCSITFYHEINDEDVDSANNLTIENAIAILTKFGAWAWNVLGLFTKGTTSLRKVDLIAWHFDPQTTDQEFQSSVIDASWSLVQPSVST
jgi:hypothetical protein